MSSDRRSRTQSRERSDVPNTNVGNNLYIANLPIKMNQEEINAVFSKYGRLSRVDLISDPVTHESRGFAFVTFEDKRDADDAIAGLHETEIMGRRIRVEAAKRARGHPKTPGQYLGPPGASSRPRYNEPRGRSGDRRRSRSRSPYRRRERSRSRGRDRDRSRDRRRSRSPVRKERSRSRDRRGSSRDRRRD
ncbi:hypothetical protein SPRG_14282 [Saprolegnia parasitica CBS 223.65]|uniref:RRM domain-containing protein n=1 Tax=Saprolegnia parasitica (strain CBS 223.65) TaxID=695850 RepID=A0A067BQI0_SAPPC|nr:hypothetical protein SPRG_14282 [Saprolegnia parasitica CBS 223.65]KDO20523.1 hypothetical protein SPRG_14282 [Saprolegnia parasitica CBS 223.65]|eukprot:XP_012208784.1 hypothetical protein SPRG_14282 [Saprolegnia parasitica CBS 223.65]